MPEADKPVHIFTSPVLLLIPQLLKDTTEPERLWMSNLNTRLRDSFFTRLPESLRENNIDDDQNASETLAKGRHKMWVTRHAATRVERSQISIQ